MTTLTQLKLTKKQRAKKVLLAKDVLHQLDMNRFEATPGFYFLADSEGDLDVTDFRALTGEELQESLSGLPNCCVCARGALFVSAIRRYNSVDGSEFKFEFEAEGKEAEFFTKEELRDLESFFECHDTVLYSETIREEIDAEHRLRLAMEHVILNNGEIHLEHLAEEAFEYLSNP